MWSAAVLEPALPARSSARCRGRHHQVGEDHRGPNPTGMPGGAPALRRSGQAGVQPRDLQGAGQQQAERKGTFVSKRSSQSAAVADGDRG